MACNVKGSPLATRGLQSRFAAVMGSLRPFNSLLLSTLTAARLFDNVHQRRGKCSKTEHRNRPTWQGFEAIPQLCRFLNPGVESKAASDPKHSDHIKREVLHVEGTSSTSLSHSSSKQDLADVWLLIVSIVIIGTIVKAAY